MATNTPIHHPKRHKQLGKMYPHRLTVMGINVQGNADPILQNEPCAYQSKLTGEAATFDDEGAAVDLILLPEWYPQIKPKMRALLVMAGVGKRYVVADVTPGDSSQTGTLLTVTPE